MDLERLPLRNSDTILEDDPTKITTLELPDIGPEVPHTLLAPPEVISDLNGGSIQLESSDSNNSDTEQGESEPKLDTDATVLDLGKRKRKRIQPAKYSSADFTPKSAKGTPAGTSTGRRTTRRNIKVTGDNLTPSNPKVLKRGTRCGMCAGCLRTDCEKCQFCLDKPRLGGPGKKKQRCVLRTCSNFEHKKGSKAYIAILEESKINDAKQVSTEDVVESTPKTLQTSPSSSPTPKTTQKPPSPTPKTSQKSPSPTPETLQKKTPTKATPKTVQKTLSPMKSTPKMTQEPPSPMKSTPKTSQKSLPAKSTEVVTPTPPPASVPVTGVSRSPIKQLASAKKALASSQISYAKVAQQLADTKQLIHNSLKDQAASSGQKLVSPYKVTPIPIVKSVNPVCSPVVSIKKTPVTTVVAMPTSSPALIVSPVVSIKKTPVCSPVVSVKKTPVVAMPTSSPALVMSPTPFVLTYGSGSSSSSVSPVVSAGSLTVLAKRVVSLESPVPNVKMSVSAPILNSPSTTRSKVPFKGQGSSPKQEAKGSKKATEVTTEPVRMMCVQCGRERNIGVARSTKFCSQRCIVSWMEANPGLTPKDAVGDETAAAANVPAVAKPTTTSSTTTAATETPKHQESPKPLPRALKNLQIDMAKPGTKLTVSDSDFDSETITTTITVSPTFSATTHSSSSPSIRASLIESLASIISQQQKVLASTSLFTPVSPTGIWTAKPSNTQVTSVVKAMPIASKVSPIASKATPTASKASLAASKASPAASKASPTAPKTSPTASKTPTTASKTPPTASKVQVQPKQGEKKSSGPAPREKIPAAKGAVKRSSNTSQGSSAKKQKMAAKTAPQSSQKSVSFNLNPSEASEVVPPGAIPFPLIASYLQPKKPAVDVSKIKLPPGLPSDVRQWTVSQVVEYFKSTPDCKGYVDLFVHEEVDGISLLLLTHETLVKCLGIKLGRAVKIMSKVEELKAYHDHRRHASQ